MKGDRKEYKIYKEDLVVAEYNSGWIIHSKEKKWIRNFLKKNKNNIYKSELLEELVRNCYVFDFIELFKKCFLNIKK